MGFENKYPYTDFHEMNLDWILEVVKGIETEWPEFRTEMQTAWQQYQDNLTGEGGEWPTFKDEMTQDFDDFIRLFIDEFDNMHAYTVGDYVVQDGQVYKCEALPSPSHALPIEFDEYTWLRISNGVINQFSHEIMAIESSVKTFIERMVPEYSDQEYYNKDMIVRKASTFAPTFPYDFYIAKQLITPETWTPSHWERVNSFAQAISDVCAINKQEMQDQYDQFLEDYQRTFGVVQTRGSSTTDVMSQKAVSDELQAHDDMIDNLIKDIAPVYDSTKAYKIGNLLTYLGKQYYCIADAPAGTLPTNTTYFEEKSVADIIEMIKQGSIVVGHAGVADNLTPWSEDSGAIQDTPFISQETGTANNTVIVTTGDTAKQLEKLGNAVVVNQPFSLSVASATNITITGTENDFVVQPTVDYSAVKSVKIPLIVGHIYLAMGTIDATLITTQVATRIGFFDTNGINKESISAEAGATASGYALYTAEENTYMGCRLPNGAETTESAEFENVKCVDLTQWFDGNENIPQDVLDNPSHFSWYCNGSLTYNAGEIKHGEGVKLVCTRGRNLWNEQWEVGAIQHGNGQDADATNVIRSIGYTRIIPNVKYYWKGATAYIHVYDKDKNHIGKIADYTSPNTFFTAPSNAQYLRFQMTSAYGTTYNHNITITPYYTPEQGGEGYDQYYPYEEPDIIDTGSEQLGAFDKKIPDGVITRGGATSPKLKNLNWGYTTSYNVPAFRTTDLASVIKHASNNSEIVDVISTQYTKKGVNQLLTSGDMQIGVDNGGTVYITDTRYNDVTSFVNHFTDNDVIEYPLATLTTEQGTSFRQYAGINDYGIMYWLGANDELVSIPQGCKIQYPVNYKGFIDDAYMYTNGDATAIALKDDITDSALNARGYYKMQVLLTTFGANGMVGGTLRHCLASSTEGLTFENTICVDLSTLSWGWSVAYSCYVANLPNRLVVNTGSGNTKAYIPTMLTKDYTYNYNLTADKTFAYSGSNEAIYIKDNTLADNITAFVESLKGVLLACEKAST